MATIKDIAKKMNLGVSTVSMALNNNPRISQATRQEVMRVANEMGYVKNWLAADLQGGRNNLILVIVDDASRPYFSRFIDIVQNRIAYHGFDLLISTTFNNHLETAKRYLSQNRGAGAIVFTMQIDDDFINKCANEEFPIYVFGREVDGNDNVYCQKEVSYYLSGYLSTNYLIGQGFKRIAYVRQVLSTLGTPRRFEGYLKALAENGIAFDEGIVFDVNRDNGKNIYDNGYLVTEEIIKNIHNKKIDAVFYSNDSLALGGLKCFSDAAVNVPEDISVIGYGDLPYSRFLSPTLSTVGSPDYMSVYNYGVDILVKAINNEDTSSVDEYYRELLLNAREIVYERGSVRRK